MKISVQTFACAHCGEPGFNNRPPEDAVQHAADHHPGERALLTICPLCPRCDKPMSFFARIGISDEWMCPTCRRTVALKRTADAPEGPPVMDLTAVEEGRTDA